MIQKVLTEKYITDGRTMNNIWGRVCLFMCSLFNVFVSFHSVVVQKMLLVRDKLQDLCIFDEIEIHSSTLISWRLEISEGKNN